MLVLSACAQSASVGRIKAGIDLGELPDSLRRPCSDPGVRAGADARIELARTRKALASCKRRQADTIKTYDKTKKEFNK